MPIRIDGDNATATPGITGGDADTGLVFGTDEVSVVTGGTEQAKVDSSGRLLVGTFTARSPLTHSPSIQVEGLGYAASTVSITSNSNDTNGSYFFLGKSRGTSLNSNTVVQSGDEIGGLDFIAADGTQLLRAARITSLIDGTPGSNDMPGRLVFSTTADGAGSPTERMRIDRNGKWYLDNTDLFDGTYIGQIRVTNTGGLLFRNGGTAARFPLGFQSSTGAFVGSISAGNSSTSYNTSSDYRLKENIVEITDGISRIKQLQPKRFNFIIDTEKTVDGFIAHEVQDIIPEAIHGEKDAVDDEGNPIYQGIDQSKLVPLLTAALQEAIAKIETLEAEKIAQQTQLDDLIARVTALETN